MQQGGSPYGAPPPPELSPSPSPSPFQHMAPEAAPPISARAPPANYEEMRAAAAAADENEGGGGGVAGNRWPRQETLALLKIRSEMDAAFRDATLKGPLWDEVSRKLEELGYRRSAKKCKEKFENVHKYYKRTKEGRAGRQDGKSYRFFSQLEALHNIAAAAPPPLPAPAIPPAPPMEVDMAGLPAMMAPDPSSKPLAPDNPTVAAAAAAGISFSSNTDTWTGSEEGEEEEEGPSSGRKRKRESGGGMSRKTMAFFEGLMRQVMERQEAMQRRFLDAIERREQDRMIRDEAWRRQEISRLSREHDLAAQERAASASRDAAIISFLHKLSAAHLPVPTNVQAPPPPPAPQPRRQQTPPPPQVQQQQQAPPPEIVGQQQHHPAPQQLPSSTDLVPTEPQEGASAAVVVSVGQQDAAATARWPKSEVHDLINLRSELDTRYQETAPKGPLWEEISARMGRLGYSRSAKRCKEKWENINKYFKKVKESNKKRPDDAKTCPYFHQLDALYRSKLLAPAAPLPALPAPISMLPPPPPPHQGEVDIKNVSGGDAGNNGGVGAMSFFGEGTSAGGGDIMKKPEDIVKELMGQSNNNPDYGDSDNMDEDDYDDEDDEDDDGKGQYMIQFQRPGIGNPAAAAGSSPAPPTSTAAAAAGGKSSGSFLAMVR